MISRKRYRAWKAFKRIQGRVLDARGRKTFPVLASPKFPFLYLSNAWGWRKNSKRFETFSARLFAKKVRKHVKPEYVRWRHNCIWGRRGAQTQDTNSKSFILLFIFLIIVFLILLLIFNIEMKLCPFFHIRICLSFWIVRQGNQSGDPL